MLRKFSAVAVLAAALLLITGCTSAPSGNESSSTTIRNGSKVLRVLAGSELADMVPILKAAEKAIGVDVEVRYVGTIDGTEEVASGAVKGRYDAVWFPSDNYLSLLPAASTATSTSVKIMSSPVVLGLRPEVARALGWNSNPPTWKQVAQAAAAGQFTYGMTDPAASNSGFSALVSVVTALSGTGTALTPANITAVTPQLTDFLADQTITAASSGLLATKYSSDSTAADGIIDYESVLVGLRPGGEKLAIIRPTDGVVTSDYPLTLLSSAAASKRALFTKLTNWLTTAKIQKEIVAQTHRRPGVPGIPTGSTFPTRVLFETPFPNTLGVANSLISAYLNNVRPPGETIVLVDNSGSMQGASLGEVQTALQDLTGPNQTGANSFTELRDQQKFTLIPFSNVLGPSTTVTIAPTGNTAAFATINAFSIGLTADGNTAIYSSLRGAYKIAVKDLAAKPGSFASIVVLTDGGNNAGISAASFESYFSSLGAPGQQVPTYVVTFGGDDTRSLTAIANLTGGSAFDASNGDVSTVLEALRGYR